FELFTCSRKSRSDLRIAARFQLRSREHENKCLDAIQRILRVSKTIKCEVQLLAISHGYEQITNRQRVVSLLEKIAQREEIPLRLRHLFAFHKQMFPMDPEPNERVTCCSFALRDFVFMMRKDVIHAAAMDVERVAKILHRHSGTFKMPTRTTFTKWRRP